MPDSDLIQIFLDVNPADLVRVNSYESKNDENLSGKSSKNFFKYLLKNNLISESEQISKKDFPRSFSALSSNNPNDLLKQIRDSIQRLSQMQSSKENVKTEFCKDSQLPTQSKLNKLLLNLKPIAKDKKFLRKKRIQKSETYYDSSSSSEINFSKISKDSSYKSSDYNNKNLLSSRSIVQSLKLKNFLIDPIRIHNPETIRLEIEQISQRLMKLKEELNNNKSEIFSYTESSSSKRSSSGRYSNRIAKEFKQDPLIREKSTNTIRSTKSSAGYYSSDSKNYRKLKQTNKNIEAEYPEKSFFVLQAYSERKDIIEEENLENSVKDFKVHSKHFSNRPLNIETCVEPEIFNFEDELALSSPINFSLNKIEETNPPVSIGKLDLGQLDSSPERRRRRLIQLQNENDSTKNWWEIEIYPRQSSAKNQFSILKSSSSKNSKMTSSKRDLSINNSKSRKLKVPSNTINMENFITNFSDNIRNNKEIQKKLPDWIKLLPLNNSISANKFNDDGPATETRLLCLPSKGIIF